jgi:hypothetical protein
MVQAEYEIVSSQVTELGHETLLRVYLRNTGSGSLTAVTLEVIDPLLIGPSGELVGLSISDLPINQEVVVNWTILDPLRM